MPRFLVYTCVFGGYDRIYPPIRHEDGVDYVCVTDRPDTVPGGWRAHMVDPSSFASPKAANLHYRALAHRVLPGYDGALYMDGNVRRTRPVHRLMADFLAVGSPLGVFAHPLRDRVEEEASVLLTDGPASHKVRDRSMLLRQLQAIRDEGFPDTGGLIETTVMLRNHRHPDLDRVMQGWADEFARWPTRDQISLPVVLWREGVVPHRLPGSFRDRGSGFHISPHHASPRSTPRYAHVHARAASHPGFKVLLAAWHARWSMMRLARRLRGRS
jgi:hypothetical protein